MPTTIIGDTIVAYFAINALLFFMAGITMRMDKREDNEEGIRELFLSNDTLLDKAVYYIFFPVMFPTRTYLEIIDEYDLWEEMTEK